MKNILVFTPLLTILFLAQSCKKDLAVKIDIQKFWKCSASQNFDSTKLADELIGSWRWAQFATEAFSKNADKIVNVTFTRVGKFSISENSKVITTGDWSLIAGDSNTFELNLSTPGEYLYGRILLCGDQLVFNNSYLDGSDELFNRIK
jgi:hypothetical protein